MNRNSITQDGSHRDFITFGPAFLGTVIAADVYLLIVGFLISPAMRTQKSVRT
jgi:hypothetical protein